MYIIRLVSTSLVEMATHSTIIPQSSSVEVVTSESDPQLSSVTSKSGTLSSTVLPQLSGDGEGGGSSSQSSVAAGIGGGIAAAVVLLIAVVVVVVVLVYMLRQRKAVDLHHEERADADGLDNPVYSGSSVSHSGMGLLHYYCLLR